MWFLLLATYVCCNAEPFRCPQNLSHWDARARKLRCGNGSRLYHCSLDEKGKPFEFCHERSLILPGQEGCPWFYRQNGKTYIGFEHSSCPSNVTGCPTKNHGGYYSDTLYIYPKCLLSVEEREKEIEAGNDRRDKIITCRNITTSVQAYCEKENASITVLATLFCLVTIVAVVACIYIAIKRRDKGKRRKNELNEGEPLMSKETKETDPSVVDDESRRQKLMRQLCREDDPTPMETTVMKMLAEHMSGHNSAVLFGQWGSGKSTIAEYYCGKEREKRNENRKFWKFDCTDAYIFSKSVKDGMRSMYEKEEIKRKFKNAKPSQIVANTLESYKSIHFTLVFENVSSKCLDDVKYILKHRQPDDKFIITVQNQPLCNALQCYGRVFEVEGFEENEAVEYLKYCFDDKMHCKKISSLLHCSPVALHFARSYIVSSNLSSGAGKDIFEKLMDVKDERAVKDESAPVAFVINILSQLYPQIYSMLECLHVIGTHEIPIALIQFMKVPYAGKTVEFQANIFVQVVRKFSFITVTDYDDNRVLNIKTEIMRKISEITSEERKRDCLLTMLKIFAWIFSKRTGPPITREISIQLIPHATKVLKAALRKDQNYWSSHELPTLSLLCDRFAYTVYSIGYKETADKCLEHLLKHSEVLRILLKKQPTDVSLDEFCKQTALAAIEEIEKTYKQNKSVIDENAKEFVLGKVRRDRNISFMKTFFLDPIDNHQLSIHDYQALVAEDKAIPLENIGLWFVFQSMLNISLTLGLKGLIGTCSSRMEKAFETENLKYILFAIHIAKHLKQIKGFTNINIYSVLDCEINGAPEITLNEKDSKKCKDTEKELKSALENMRENGYFVGCVKIDSSIDLCHEINARKQLLRIALKMENKEKSLERAEELHSFLFKHKDKLRDSFHAQCAKQWVAHAYITYQKSEDALGILHEVSGLSSFDVFDLEHTVTAYDFIDLELKCRCLKELDKLEELKEHTDKMDALNQRLEKKQTTVYSLLPGLIDEYTDI